MKRFWIECPFGMKRTFLGEYSYLLIKNKTNIAVDYHVSDAHIHHNIHFGLQ